MLSHVERDPNLFGELRDLGVQRGLREMETPRSTREVMDRTAELAGARGSLLAELESAERSRGQSRELERIDERIARLTSEIDALEQRLKISAEEENDTQQRVNDLPTSSRTFWTPLVRCGSAKHTSTKTPTFPWSTARAWMVSVPT
jgi:predicted nuclease with TOPRIM domain